MKVEVREVGVLQKELDIHLDTDEVNRFIDGLISGYRRRYALPGFRPGKAPDGVVRARFQDEIERAVFTELVPDSIDRAVAENQIRPAASGDISTMRFRPGEPLAFTVKFSVWPEVALKPCEEIELEQVVESVTPEQVEAFLGQIRERAADSETVGRAARDGDLIEAELETVDAEGNRVKGTKREKVTLEVGNANLLPEFREAAGGLAAGQERDFEVAYPEDFGQESLRGQKRRYRLRALEIKEKKLPALDDAFAKQFDPNLDLDGLRARVRLRIESERRLAAREDLEERLIDALIAANPFDLPEPTVRAPLERLIERVQKQQPSAGREDLERTYRPQIERLQRRDFLLAKVAEQEGIRVTPADVEGEIEKMARGESRTVEEVRKDLGDIERYRQFLFERKVFEALLGKVKVRELQVPGRGPQ
ncbi:MAG: trigger factor [Candidatus Eisenbacteria bacterium]